MSESIKLTEEDIHIISAAGGYTVKLRSLEGLDIIWNEKQAKQIKQQILDNQEKAERYDDYTNCCQHSDDEYCIWNHKLHIIKQENKALKKKLTNKNIKHLHKKDLNNLKCYRENFLKNKKIIEKIKQIQSLLINNKKPTRKERDILETFASMSVFEFIKKYYSNSQTDLQNKKEVIES